MVALFYQIQDVFLNTIASESSPIVFVLDDLQWMDQGSRDIMRSFATDLDSKYVLHLGTFRIEDGDENPDFDCLLQLSGEQCIPFAHFEISALDVSCIKSIVA